MDQSINFQIRTAKTKLLITTKMQSSQIHSDPTFYLQGTFARLISVNQCYGKGIKQLFITSCTEPVWSISETLFCLTEKSKTSLFNRKVINQWPILIHIPSILGTKTMLLCFFCARVCLFHKCKTWLQVYCQPMHKFDWQAHELEMKLEIIDH